MHRTARSGIASSLSAIVVRDLFSGRRPTKCPVRYRPFTVRKSRERPKSVVKKNLSFEWRLHQLSRDVLTHETDYLRDFLYREVLLRRESRDVTEVRKPVNILRETLLGECLQHRLSS